MAKIIFLFEEILDKIAKNPSILYKKKVLESFIIIFE